MLHTIFGAGVLFARVLATVNASPKVFFASLAFSEVDSASGGKYSEEREGLRSRMEVISLLVVRKNACVGVSG